MKNKLLDYYKKAGIVLTDAEKQGLEIVDFGLGDFEKVGLSLCVYVNTERVLQVRRKRSVAVWDGCTYTCREKAKKRI